MKTLLKKKGWKYESEKDFPKIYFDTIFFEDGGFYQGFLLSKVPSGLGIFVYPDGKFHMGMYKKGVLNGLCRINFENQDVYDGMTNNGRMEGEGFFYDSGSNAWINGIFSEDCCVKLISNGENFPKMEIKNFRSNLHYQNDNFLNRDCSTVLVDITQLYSPEIFNCQEPFNANQVEESLSKITEEEGYNLQMEKKKEHREIFDQANPQDIDVNEKSQEFFKDDSEIFTDSMNKNFYNYRLDKSLNNSSEKENNHEKVNSAISNDADIIGVQFHGKCNSNGLFDKDISYENNIFDPKSTNNRNREKCYNENPTAFSDATNSFLTRSFLTPERQNMNKAKKKSVEKNSKKKQLHNFYKTKLTEMDKKGKKVTKPKQKFKEESS